MSDPLQRKLDTLPDGPGVYLWKDATGTVIYVGKAKNLRSRVRSYLTGSPGESLKHALLSQRIADVETIVVGNEAQSLLLESNLIKEYLPRFNVLLKDDKSYPSIVVTVGEAFPRVFATRRRDIRGARYFGPFTDVGEMRRMLTLIRRMFTVRSCADDLPRERRERPCLDYHIGRCRAPCVGKQSATEYGLMMSDVVTLLEGRTVDLRTRIRVMMSEASAREDYERAGELRDILRWLEEVETPSTVDVVGTGDADVIGYARDGADAVAVLFRVRNGKIIGREHRFLDQIEEEEDAELLEAALVQWYLPLAERARKLILPLAPRELDAVVLLLGSPLVLMPQRGVASRWLGLADQNARHLLESLRMESFETEERVEDPVYSLGRELGMTTVPRTFVCIDISTNQGRDTVGSLITFEAGRPKKSEYRKFKIKGAGQQDDYAAIHEVVTRYVTRRRDEGVALPDLIVIDGGKGQLGAALDALTSLGAEGIPLASLAKREEEIFLPGAETPLRLSRRSPALRLLQRARDEAHRFGVTYNRQRRSARTITSALLNIPGVGSARRRVLLEAFGSLAGVRAASAAEIGALPGFSLALAERILEMVKQDP